MLNIEDVSPNIVVDVRYATNRNFTNRILYKKAVCTLCEPTAYRLARVQKALEKDGLGLKAWDCYRPISVQKILWSVVPDPRYVANPKKGSRHNRGTAVDVTLVDSQGRELPMPSDFDEFGPQAHRDYQNLPKHILRNRKKLEDAMAAEGFIGLPTEWWHFDDPKWKNYALRDDPVGSPTLKKDIKTKEGMIFIPKTPPNPSLKNS